MQERKLRLLGEWEEVYGKVLSKPIETVYISLFMTLLASPPPKDFLKICPWYHVNLFHEFRMKCGLSCGILCHGTFPAKLY